MMQQLLVSEFYMITHSRLWYPSVRAPIYTRVRKVMWAIRMPVPVEA